MVPALTAQEVARPDVTDDFNDSHLHLTNFGIVDELFTDPALRQVSFDISWDEVAQYSASPESVARVVTILNRYADRFVSGTDTVATAGPEPYHAVFEVWEPVWRRLTPEASVKIRKSSSERLFDEGRRNVRAWERVHGQ